MIGSCISVTSLNHICVLLHIGCNFFYIGYFCHPLDALTTKTQQQAHQQDFISPSGYTQVPCTVRGTGQLTWRKLDYKAVNEIYF